MPGTYSAVHESMTNTTTARVDRTPTHTDLAITDLVHRALADVQDAGRFGDRKVFIASLWTQMDAGVVGALTIAANPTAAELAELGTEAAIGAADATGIGAAGAGVATGTELATAASRTDGSAPATAIGAAGAAVVRFDTRAAAGAARLALGAVGTSPRGAAAPRLRGAADRGAGSTSGTVRRRAISAQAAETSSRRRSRSNCAMTSSSLAGARRVLLMGAHLPRCGRGCKRCASGRARRPGRRLGHADQRVQRALAAGVTLQLRPAEQLDGQHVGLGRKLSDEEAAKRLGLGGSPHLASSSFRIRIEGRDGRLSRDALDAALRHAGELGRLVQAVSCSTQDLDLVPSDHVDHPLPCRAGWPRQSRVPDSRMTRRGGQNFRNRLGQNFRNPQAGSRLP